MIPPNDVVADLPAPLDDEPPSVRQDIADELADHLACAYRRELLKTADERTAQQQVLDRFGNPQRIAYQLWFQALWGRIMLNRFGRIVQGLKIVGGLLVLFFVFRMAEQQTALHNQLVMLAASNQSMQSQAFGTRSLLEQLLARFPAPPQPENSSGMGSEMSSMMMGSDSPPGMPGMGTAFYDPAVHPGATSATMGESTHDPNAVKRGLKLRITVEGKPASNCFVSVVNESGEALVAPVEHAPMGGEMEGMGSSMGMMPGMPAGAMGMMSSAGRNSAGKPAVWLLPQMNGEIHFSQAGRNQPSFLDPGRYTVQIEFRDGRKGTHRFAVPPNHKKSLHEEEIECPPADQKAYITFHAAVLDKKYADAGIQARAVLTRKPLRIGKADWTETTGLKRWTIHFDSASGAPVKFQAHHWVNNQDHSKPIDLADLPTEERFVTLPAGTYQVEMTWVVGTDYSTGITLVSSRRMVQGKFLDTFPAAGAATNGVLSLTADTRDVLLGYPEDDAVGASLNKLFLSLKASIPQSPVSESTAPADASTVPR